MPSKVRKKYIKNQLELQQQRKEKKQNDFLNKNIKEYHVNEQIILLDFLLKTLNEQSKNNVKMLLSKRYIAVNGNCVTQFNYMLYKKDIVQLSKTPFDKVSGRTKVEKKVNKEEQTSELEILYEDSDFLVINKPSGLLSVESDNEKVKTAYKLVLEYMSSIDKNARVFQVHRLDKDTSGVLLFVKSFELKEALAHNWNKLVLERRYIAIVEGKMPKKQDTIVSWLAKDENNLMYDTHKTGVGEKAITHYVVKKEGSKYSYLDVLIDSGKKNQIRVALAGVGNPIVGDDKYGTISSPIGRLGLHASVLRFKHPVTGKEYRFFTDAPSEFRKIFK